MEDDGLEDKPKKGEGKKGRMQDAEEDKLKPKKGSAKRGRPQDNAENDAKKPKKGKALNSTARGATVREIVEPPRKKPKVKQEVVEGQKAPRAKPAKKTNGGDTAVASGRRRSTRLSNNF